MAHKGTFYKNKFQFSTQYIHTINVLDQEITLNLSEGDTEKEKVFATYEEAVKYANEKRWGCLYAITIFSGFSVMRRK